LSLPKLDCRPLTFKLIDVSSIVAVHGLNGSGRKTWTDKETGTFWLEDLLPTSFPTARIMTFAYDSALAFSKSKAGVETFARDLLNRLRMLRGSEVDASGVRIMNTS
jgi:hypothetical protein